MDKSGSVAERDTGRIPAALWGQFTQAFSLSGLTKLRDWGTTVALSRTSTKSRCGALRRLPSRTRLMSWFCRCCWCWAWLGGFAALGLFVVNAVAVIALSDTTAATLQQRVFWCSVLAGPAIFGAGPWLLNGWLASRRQAPNR
jgi:putative oxidoreductase